MRRFDLWLALVAAIVALFPTTLSSAGGIVHGDKGVSIPSPTMVKRWNERFDLLEQQRSKNWPGGPRAVTNQRLAGLTGQHRILIILVEFGADTITFIPDGENRSTWDPVGNPDSSEWTGTVGDCSIIIQRNNIVGPTDFTYRGPLHNQIERPLSTTHDSRNRIWREDFSPEYYRELAFGNGSTYEYQREDGSQVKQDGSGLSISKYFADMSRGQFQISGDVVGWVQVPHSLFYYGADPCPGLRSGSSSATNRGAIPGVERDQLLKDAIDAVKAANPNFDWTR